jgi:hypothetical protein
VWSDSSGKQHNEFGRRGVILKKRLSERDLKYPGNGFEAVLLAVIRLKGF